MSDRIHDAVIGIQYTMITSHHCSFGKRKHPLSTAAVSAARPTRKAERGIGSVRTTFISQQQIIYCVTYIRYPCPARYHHLVYGAPTAALVALRN